MALASTTEEQATPGSRLHALLDELQAVAVEIDDVGFYSIDFLELTEAVKRLPAVVASVDAAVGRVLGAAEDHHVARRHRCRSLRQFLNVHTNESGAAFDHRRRRVNWLRDFAVFEQAHLDGVMTAAHLDRIRRGLDNPRTHFALVREQKFFVEQARNLDFRDFERVCDYWRIAADPDGEEPNEQLAKARFRAEKRPDGMVSTEGLHDPLSGAIILTAVSREIQKLRRTDAETGRTRSQGELGHEALLRLITRGAARADGTQPDPLINIVMSLDVARDQVRRLAEEGADQSDLPVDADDIDGRCELIDGTPIHPHLAMSLLCIARLERVVMDAPDRIINASLPTRGFAKWQKRLAAVRQRGRCYDKGCDAPFPWMHADHDHPWSKGGATSVCNCKLRCEPHNLAKGDRLAD